MKSIKELAWNVTEEVYRKDPALSYSTLSKFEREGWRKISSLFDKVETPYLTFGSAVDIILTEGMEAFEQNFIVCEFPPLSDSLITITKILYERFKDEHRKVSTISDSSIDEVAVANNYYANPKYANYRVKNIKESCDEYYSLLALAGDKKVLSQTEYNNIINCVEELKNNPVTRDFFSVDPWNTDIEKVFQLKFKAEYNGAEVRCMLDETIVDHKNKIIYPIDLKTTSHPEEGFQDSFLHWRYDIQSKLYTYILSEVIKKDSYFKDFKIAPYQFIVVNTVKPAPIVWEFHGNFGEMDLTSRGNSYRDWRKIINDLRYYLANPNARYSREAVRNDCRMTIDI